MAGDERQECVLLTMATVFAMFWASSYSTIVLPEDYYPDLESHLGNIEYTVFVDAHREVQWRIPYWSITIPMTLLSAYLIVWPGKGKAKRSQSSEAAPVKIIDPIPTRESESWASFSGDGDG